MPAQEGICTSEAFCYWQLAFTKEWVGTAFVAAVCDQASPSSCWRQGSSIRNGNRSLKLLSVDFRAHSGFVPWMAHLFPRLRDRRRTPRTDYPGQVESLKSAA